ncbi:hypothetical protein HY485_02280 [Candidatus Woesearchaeota archaeon]|nr:hypothetical protein [Candidatus Woesearchaeota archaeon]
MNKMLQKELLRMMKEDQDMRRSMKRVEDYDISVDERNLKRMKEIVEMHGWPTYNSVGEDGAFAAWLLVQHADRDPEFQKRCLDLLEQAVKANQADKASLAYLTDRVLVHEGKKQVYGTQFYVDKKGVYGPRPIKDQKHLDERRAAVGLEPFVEYEAGLRKNVAMWDKNQQKQ